MYADIFFIGYFKALRLFNIFSLPKLQICILKAQQVFLYDFVKYKLLEKLEYYYSIRFSCGYIGLAVRTIRSIPKNLIRYPFLKNSKR